MAHSLPSLKNNFSSLTPTDFISLITTKGFTKNQGEIFTKYFYRQENFSLHIPKLSLVFKKYLQENFNFDSLTLKKSQIDLEGNGKIAFETHDGFIVESVLLQKKNNTNSICISTQAGCGVGCIFCATGKLGFKRNLQAYEIVEQVRQTYLTFLKGKPLTHITIMGMGEPLENLEAVYQAFLILTSPLTYMVGAKKITIASSGYLPGLNQLALKKPRPSLSISLHAPNQDLRQKLIPMAKNYPLPQLIHFIKNYPLKPNKKLSIQYLLLKDINDKEEHAFQLAHLLKDLPVKVNFLQYNLVQGLNLEPSLQAREEFFIQTLRNHKISALKRLSYGAEIKAACGQLGHEIMHP